ncbi:TfoX/Sxy family protein [Nocardioides sp.]|uniref:TfoX/Sxy family protein n=1 Tax=Nocardioides sp. TaxID=35761 RepID=UPI0035653263
MAYDEELAARVRFEMGSTPNVEKPMFGGLAFIVAGNMAVGVSGQGGLMVRCAPEATADLVAKPGAAPMEMRGREMDGWLRVSAESVADDATLAEWVQVGVSQAQALPPK